MIEIKIPDDEIGIDNLDTIVMANKIRRIKELNEEVETILKKIYDEGYKAGIDAFKTHFELCLEENTAHWIYQYGDTDTIKCSNCNTEYEGYLSRCMKYCSHCGAKMEEENNN